MKCEPATLSGLFQDISNLRQLIRQIAQHDTLLLIIKMTGRLAFHWGPFVKYSLVLIVYIFAGGLLFFYIEECKYSSVKTQLRRRYYLGNASSICLKFSGKLLNNVNASRRLLFVNQCEILLNKEAAIEIPSTGKCSPDWKDVSKWIKFVHNTLATIGK